MSKQQATFEHFFSEYYLHYKEYVTKYIALRIRPQYDAEDLAQDVFLRLWEYRAFVNQETIFSLLFTIARNLIIDKLRHYYVHEETVTYIYKAGNAGCNPVEETMNYQELKRVHTEVVNSLPPQRRLVYELSFKHEMSIPAIAEKLSLSQRTIEGHLYLARQTIRTYVKHEYPEVG